MSNDQVEDQGPQFNFEEEWKNGKLRQLYDDLMNYCAEREMPIMAYCCYKRDNQDEVLGGSHIEVNGYLPESFMAYHALLELPPLLQEHVLHTIRLCNVFYANQIAQNHVSDILNAAIRNQAQEESNAHKGNKH